MAEQPDKISDTKLNEVTTKTFGTNPSIEVTAAVQRLAFESLTHSLQDIRIRSELDHAATRLVPTGEREGLCDTLHSLRCHSRSPWSGLLCRRLSITPSDTQQALLCGAWLPLVEIAPLRRDSRSLSRQLKSVSWWMLLDLRFASRLYPGVSIPSCACQLVLQ